MIKATTVLRKEHEAILRMLDASERVSELLADGQPVAPETLSGLLEFFRMFADQCHHGKEEEVLFPLLEAKGMPRNGGPIGIMLLEHEQGRSLIGQMAEATSAYAAGDAASGARWARAALGYAGLLRDHIAKENNILFVMADNLLTDGEQAEVFSAFEKIETEKMGPGTHERLHGQMESLTSGLPERVR